MNMPASRSDSVKVLITGSEGFIGKNLRAHLAERNNVDMVCFKAGDNVSQLPDMLRGVDFVFHLAGVNRPEDPSKFATGNRDLTQALCDAVGRVVESTGKKMSILLTSSIQAAGKSLYGQSKQAAEEAVFDAGRNHGLTVHVFRLPNVFGKWCRPNYNSAVATFCHNIARGLPIEIHDPAAPITLVYIDDVVEQFIKLMEGANPSVDAGGFATVTPQYSTTVGDIAEQLLRFKESRHTLNSEPVGMGLSRALYATYISYLPVEEFAYALPRHADTRGVFVEMLRTPDCGQFSYFTARPGVTRGGHYHHSKTEKFLVIKGQARFQFRHLQTGETYQVFTNGDRTEIVETVPGWTHDVTNIGPDDLIVMLWANEVFNRARPDTYARPL